MTPWLLACIVMALPIALVTVVALYDLARGARRG